MSWITALLHGFRDGFVQMGPENGRSYLAQQAATDRAAAERRVVELASAEAYGFSIVGESYCQNALRRLASPFQADAGESAEVECKALLKLDNNNPHDAQAVAVLVRGERVGYLARGDAVEYRHQLKQIAGGGRDAEVRAMIVGGWERGARGRGDYGVRLALAWPIKRREVAG